jgi:hypothetical protein
MDPGTQTNLLYICRGSSPEAGKPLQIGPFMQNKANFRKSQMNVKPLIIMDYENISNWALGENKANSKPIKANFKRQ